MNRIRRLKMTFDTVTVNEQGPGYIGLEHNDRFTSSNQVFETFQGLADECKEHFYCLHLDSKNRVQCLDLVSMGSLNASIVHPREVFKGALLSSAAAILFVHNHPSGDPEPSREDLELTKRLTEAGQLLGVRVLDHVIIGRGRYTSLADQGLVTQ